MINYLGEIVISSADAIRLPLVNSLNAEKGHTKPAVPSAQSGLTSLFGKGRGEPRRNNHLKRFCKGVTI